MAPETGDGMQSKQIMSPSPIYEWVWPCRLVFGFFARRPFIVAGTNRNKSVRMRI